MKVLSLTLLLALCTSIGSGIYGLKLYRFEHPTKFTYEYVEIASGNTYQGEFVIEVEPDKGGMEVSIQGEYRDWAGVVSGTFTDAFELSGFVLMKMYFHHHWLIPLGRTLFSRGLVKMLMSGSVDWSIGERYIGGDLRAIVDRCEFRNIEGRLLKVYKGSKLLFGLCAVESIPLPTYVYRRGYYGEVYEIKLSDYRGLK